MQVDHTKFTIELQRFQWLVEIHDGKTTKYAPTKLGQSSLELYKRLSNKKLNVTVLENKEYNTEKFQWMIKNGILVRHIDPQSKSEVISATPYGFGMFNTMEFFLDEKLQKKLVRRKKILDFVSKTKKDMASFMKTVNSINSATSHYSHGGHRK